MTYAKTIFLNLFLDLVIINSNHSISSFVAFGLSLINGCNDCFKTMLIKLLLLWLIHTSGTLIPHEINERFTFSWTSVVRDLFCRFIYIYISILLFPFIFLHTYLIALSSLHHYITTNNSLRQRTTVRNASLNYFHCGVKLINLSICF